MTTPQAPAASAGSAPAIDAPAAGGSLAERSVRGIAVTMGAQLLKFALQMIGTIALARLLTPADFGLTAMVIAFIGFIDMFKDMGLPMYTVQRKEIDQSQMTTLFWLNAGVSVVISLVTALSAPLVVWFYREPRLMGITLALSLGFVLSGISIQHLALMKRQMRFKAISMMEIPSILIGLIAGLVVALATRSYWALVVQPLTTATVNSALVWMNSGWRPGPPQLHPEIRQMLKFGRNIMGTAFFNYIGNNASNVLIGRAHGAADLAYFSKAFSLLMLPNNQIMGPSSTVAIPALSRLAHSGEDYRAGFLSTIEKLAFFTLPLGVFMIAGAHEIVRVMLGTQWVESGMIFAILGINTLALPVIRGLLWNFIARDRSGLLVRWGMLECALTVGAIIVGLPGGPLGVAKALAFVGLCVRLPLAILWVGRVPPLRISDILLGLAPLASASAGAFGAAHKVREAIAPENPAALTLLSAFGSLCLIFAVTAVVYVAILALIPDGRRALREIQGLARHFGARGKSGETPAAAAAALEEAFASEPMDSVPAPPAASAAPANASARRASRKKEPKVSVVIPTYNRAPYVAEAIESVLAQTYRDYEIIVVDDGSTDGTEKALKRYLRRITLIRQENAGVAAARNAGIRAARGEWIAFLDSDDVWMPNKLELQMADLAADPNLILHACNAIWERDDGKTVEVFDFTNFRRANGGKNISARPLRQQIRYGLARIPCEVVKKSALLDAGLFEENRRIALYEDQDLNCRLALRGPWAIREEPLAVFKRRNETNTNLSKGRTRDPAAAAENLVFIYSKLAADPKLGGEDRETAMNALASAHAQLAIELACVGRMSASRAHAWRALLAKPSAKALARLAFVLLPQGPALGLLGRGKRQPDAA